MYFHNEIIHNTSAPSIILPEIIKVLEPNSILDLGCGIGTWLSVSKKLGIFDVLGVDGDYVDQNLLLKYLSEEEFISHDLTQPLNLKRKFDLCLCLEVAEHLPELAADTLIESLIYHSDTILFSAAIPGQGGQNHLNEQWPDYWIEKFKKWDFLVYDPIRPIIWANNQIDPWYRQNIFLFTKKELSLPKPIYTNLVLPEIFKSLYEQKIKLDFQINQIIEGNKSFLFYFKRSIISLFRLKER